MERVKVDNNLLKINENVINLDKLVLIEIGQEYETNCGMFRLRVFNSASSHTDLEGTHTWNEEKLASIFQQIQNELSATYPEIVNFGISKLVNLSKVVDIKLSKNVLNKEFVEIFFTKSSIKYPKQSQDDYIQLLEHFENYKSVLASII